MAVRQLRGALLSTAALTGAVVLFLGIHGALARSLSARVTAACAAGATASCVDLQLQLGAMYDGVARYLGFTTITCILIAAIWGAPMISREIESGTAALAWCQSVTRRQWFAARLTVSLIAVGALGLAFGFAVTWWAASFEALEASGRSTAGVIYVYGPLLAAEWIAGLTIGIAIGALVNRILPAVTVTAVVTLAAAITFNVTAAGLDTGGTDAAQVLASQVATSLPILALAAVAAAAAFHRLGRLRV